MRAGKSTRASRSSAPRCQVPPYPQIDSQSSSDPRSPNRKSYTLNSQTLNSKPYTINPEHKSPDCNRPQTKRDTLNAGRLMQARQRTTWRCRPGSPASTCQLTGTARSPKLETPNPKLGTHVPAQATPTARNPKPSTLNPQP
jgi:hypothetical protein